MKASTVLTCRTLNFQAQAAAADGDKHIVESNLVAEYLDHAFPHLGPRLFPTEPVKLFKVSQAYSAILHTTRWYHLLPTNHLWISIGALVCGDVL